MKLRIKRLRPPRLLRLYRRISQVTRHCSKCPHPIEPGDAYIGEVWTIPAGPTTFWVYFEHVECPFGTHEELEEEYLREDEGEDDEARERAA